ncbi:Hypothetical predicted protein [Olea europaea subsp. europaea]|uniref:Uncharacterized protein n=1 Tax=Olea europaea subsp. europaea TaxID=158383 RepID=A0A8S0PT57_OLEEU|nr:Hypothetical predicted protein [Olea europaea subsp. europaea]
MKKLYKKGTVHPTPPLVSEQVLSFLPATILTLTAALSLEDREVLAYLISCSSTNFSNNHRKNTLKTSSTAAADHRPSFNCYCFSCYTSYWVRWDSSSNRQLIHKIIDAFEDGLQMQNKKEKSKRERRKSRRNNGHNSDESKVSDLSLSKKEFTNSNSTAESAISGDAEDEQTAEDELEKGSVGGFLNFLGESFWGVWT